jgi:hypothetical protein
MQNVPPRVLTVGLKIVEKVEDVWTGVVDTVDEPGLRNKMLDDVPSHYRFPRSWNSVNDKNIPGRGSS